MRRKTLVGSTDQGESIHKFVVLEMYIYSKFKILPRILLALYVHNIISFVAIAQGVCTEPEISDK